MVERWNDDRLSSQSVSDLEKNHDVYTTEMSEDEGIDARFNMIPVGRSLSTHSSSGYNPIEYHFAPRSAKEHALPLPDHLNTNSSNTSSKAMKHSSSEFYLSSGQTRIPIATKSTLFQPTATSHSTITGQSSSRNDPYASLFVDDHLLDDKPKPWRRTPSSQSNIITRSASQPLSLSVPPDTRHDSKLAGSRQGSSTNASQPPGAGVVRSISMTARKTRPLSSEVREKDAVQLREEQIRRIQLINQAPKGPPPWLSTFQPDPRLPADQQILPTVAKKLALKRWIDEGGTEESFDDMWNAPPSRRPQDHDIGTVDEPVALAPPSAQFNRDERPGTSMSSSSALSRRILGQSPLKKRRSQMALSSSTTNFSRRSNLSASSPVSAGSQFSVDRKSQMSNDKKSYKRESHTVVKKRLDNAGLPHDDDLVRPRPWTGEATKSRPKSGFDFEDVETLKRSKQCCSIM